MSEGVEEGEGWIGDAVSSSVFLFVFFSSRLSVTLSVHIDAIVPPHKFNPLLELVCVLAARMHA